MSTIFRTLQVNKWQSKNQTFFAFCEINATKFGTENEVSHKIIMRWKKSYYIATNVSSRKGATTFGDLPDWLGRGDSGRKWLCRSSVNGRSSRYLAMMSRIVLIGICKAWSQTAAFISRSLRYLNVIDIAPFTFTYTWITDRLSLLPLIISFWFCNNVINRHEICLISRKLFIVRFGGLHFIKLHPINLTMIIKIYSTKIRLPPSDPGV